MVLIVFLDKNYLFFHSCLWEIPHRRALEFVSSLKFTAESP
jgi:hypothetical protein